MRNSTLAEEVLGSAHLPDPEILEDLKKLNILLLGYGGAGHQGGMLSDVIQVLHLDFENQRTAFISIPRDLWVELPTGTNAKINQALTMGNDTSNPVLSGAQVAKQMAAQITGLDIHYVIAVDFVGYKRIIGEVLEGIEVEVSEVLQDDFYPIKGEEQNICDYTPEEVAELSATLSGFELEKQFECRYEKLYFPVGTQEMHGHEALAYVRSRHGSSGGDFSRSKRQHEVLMGIRNKLLSLEVFSLIPEFYEFLTAHVTTDLSLESAQHLGPTIQTLSTSQPKSVVISTENVLKNSTSSNGQYIVVPKDGSYQSIASFVTQQLE